MKSTEKLVNDVEKLIKGIYKDTWLNRRLGRVGQYYGKDVSPELKKYRETTTEHMYKKNGRWSPERIKLHREIVNSFFERKLPSIKKPTAVILAGGAGSGKTYVYEKFHGKIDDNSVYINSDDIKNQIPEYEQFIEKDYQSAAYKVHEESSLISKVVITQAIDNNYNITIDTTLSNKDKAEKLIQRLKDRGYDIKLIFVDVPFDKAWRSAQKRGADTKRWVPRHIVEKSNVNSRKVVKSLIKSKAIKYIAWYNNSGLNKKLPPKRMRINER